MSSKLESDVCIRFVDDDDDVCPVTRALDLRLKKSRVRLSAVPLSGNNLGQVVHTHVPLSPSSIIWYRSTGGDALQLGR